MLPDTAYHHPALRALRSDLALALRAADHHGLGEGICNHFSVAVQADLAGGPDRFLINPQGVHWRAMRADDIVLVDEQGRCLAGRHPVEATAMFIHAAVHRLAGKVCVLHTHMPHATAFTLTEGRALDPCLSQTAMRFQGRIAIDPAYNGLALDVAEGERIARAMGGADVAFLANHGVIVCGTTLAHAFDDLYYLERACQVQWLAEASGRPLAPVAPALAARVAAQIEGERAQSDGFFKALGRLLPEP